MNDEIEGTIILESTAAKRRTSRVANRRMPSDSASATTDAYRSPLVLGRSAGDRQVHVHYELARGVPGIGVRTGNPTAINGGSISSIDDSTRRRPNSEWSLAGAGW